MRRPAVGTFPLVWGYFSKHRFFNHVLLYIRIIIVTVFLLYFGALKKTVFYYVRYYIRGDLIVKCGDISLLLATLYFGKTRVISLGSNSGKTRAQTPERLGRTYYLTFGDLPSYTGQLQRSSYFGDSRENHWSLRIGSPKYTGKARVL